MRRNNLFDEHTLDILKVAMPHVHPRAQGGMNVLLKANDLMTTIEHGGQDGEISAMELNEWTPEPEELLLSIKQVANPAENEIVDMMLNFFKVRKLYSAYQTYSDTVLEAQGISKGNGGYRRNNMNPFASLFGMNQATNQRNHQNRNQNRNANAARNTSDSSNTMNAAGSKNGQMPNFFNFLMSQMSPEQKQTFDMLNMMMNSTPNNRGNVSGQSVNNAEQSNQDNTASRNNNMRSQSVEEEATTDNKISES